MSSDRTTHHARSVGQGRWTVSFLPGRTLTTDQAVAALRAAEEIDGVQRLARAVGLTAAELAGMAAVECSWAPAEAGQPRNRFGLRRTSGSQ
ncbi:hypothetical protein [Nocardia sp. CNY236]|uniref:hypothetical protein n=1 Tax=Nocardia sp. CNY236 TaxID=1169152 RepID=UPI001E3B0A43|nr:hypothetical protein [Nocardia sp. CNY236]